MTKRERVYPVPGAFDGTEWSIGDDFHGATDVIHHEMDAPLQATPCECGQDHAEAIRLHEMCHILLNDEENPQEVARRLGIRRDAVVAAYEMAVEFTLSCDDTFRQRDGGVCHEELRRIAAKVLKSENPAHVIGLFAASFYNDKEAMPIREVTMAGAEDLGLVDAPFYTNSMVEQAHQIVNGAASVFFDIYERDTTDSVPSRDDIERVARLFDMFLVAQEELKEASVPQQELDARSEAMMEMLRMAMKDMTELDARSVERYDHEAFQQGEFLDTSQFKSRAMEGIWGTMELREPPRPITIRPPKVGRRLRQVEEGTHLRNIARWATDKHVFSARRKSEGGTVLVDCSGSMSWTREELLRIIEDIPAATIALYSGESWERSYVTVVVRNRRRVNDADFYSPGGDNLIDGPALEWLGTQAEPRIWVSDGGVTGDGNYAALHADATRLQLRNRIRRVHTVKGAHEAFRNPRLGSYSTRGTTGDEEYDRY